MTRLWVFISPLFCHPQLKPGLVHMESCSGGQDIAAYASWVPWLLSTIGDSSQFADFVSPPPSTQKIKITAKPKWWNISYQVPSWVRGSYRKGNWRVLCKSLFQTQKELKFERKSKAEICSCFWDPLLFYSRGFLPLSMENVTDPGLLVELAAPSQSRKPFRLHL